MSKRCKKCGIFVFDDNAYKRIEKIEHDQIQYIFELTEGLKRLETKYGYGTEETVELKRRINSEIRVLEIIWKCKKSL